MKPSPSSSIWSFDLLWEIPLSFLSLIFFKINKAIIGFLYHQYLSRSSARATTWRILGAETLKIPISLPVLMTKGPRWNTHGVVGTLGPFSVQSTVAVNLKVVRRSAQSWTIVVYRYPDFTTVTQLSWLSADLDQLQETITLAPGQYSLGIRYYGLFRKAEMPTLVVDQSQILLGEEIEANNNAFYQHLSDRSNVYYLALHYYIYTLLRLQSVLPESWVRTEYLPVGDPDTTFLYDYFDKGDSLQININPDIFKTYWVYVTGYSRASLPIFSQELHKATQTTPPLKHQGYYLFRIRPKSSDAPPLDSQDVVVQKV